MPRPPQPPAALPARDPALDGLRGLAILLVFLFHYGGGLTAHNPLVRSLGYLTQAGWVGVDLFFALSGFLITGILAAALYSGPAHDRSSAQRKLLRNFYARRALRILPLYFAALLASAAAALLSGASVPQLRPLLVYVAFLQNLPPLLNTALHTPAPLPLFHLWSLAVEEQFYLLWPFALLLARTPRRAFHLSLYTFAASCLFRVVLFAPHLFPWATANSFATFLPTRAGALALGSALALYDHLRLNKPNGPTAPHADAASPASHSQAAIPRQAKRSEQSPVFARPRAEDTSQRLMLAAITVSLAVIFLTAVHTHNFLLNSRPAFLLILPAVDVFSAALVALTLHPNMLRAALSTRPLRFLGRISYGFYVLHILLEPFYDRLGTLLTHTQSGFAYQAARFFVALPITTAAAWSSYILLERPFLRMKCRFPSSSTPAI